MKDKSLLFSTTVLYCFSTNSSVEPSASSHQISEKQWTVPLGPQLQTETKDIPTRQTQQEMLSLSITGPPYIVNILYSKNIMMADWANVVNVCFFKPAAFSCSTVADLSNRGCSTVVHNRFTSVVSSKDKSTQLNNARVIYSPGNREYTMPNTAHVVVQYARGSFKGFFFWLGQHELYFSIPLRVLLSVVSTRPRFEATVEHHTVPTPLGQPWAVQRLNCPLAWVTVG